MSLTEQGFDVTEGLPTALADWLVAIDAVERAAIERREAERTANMLGSG